MPSIIWNYAAIRLCGSVDDPKYDRALIITTQANIFHDANAHTGARPAIGDSRSTRRSFERIEFPNRGDAARCALPARNSAASQRSAAFATRLAAVQRTSPAATNEPPSAVDWVASGFLFVAKLVLISGHDRRKRYGRACRNDGGRSRGAFSPRFARSEIVKKKLLVGFLISRFFLWMILWAAIYVCGLYLASASNSAGINLGGHRDVFQVLRDRAFLVGSHSESYWAI